MANYAKARFSKPKIKPNELIYLYFEGSNSEPGYFKDYKNNKRLSSVHIKDRGFGSNTADLIKAAKKGAREASCVWIVCDRDNITQASYNELMECESTPNIKFAYSNECFELWFQLHFEFTTGQVYSPDERVKKLSGLIGKEIRNKHFRYEKNLEGMFDILKSKTAIAISNSKKLKIHHSPHTHNSSPVTNIDNLIETVFGLPDL